MKATVVLALLMSLGAGRSAGAMVLEVPVPGLIGTDQDFYRTAIVHLPSIPSVIHGVALRVTGTTTLSEWSCDGPGGYGPPRPVPTNLIVEALSPSGVWIVEQRNDVSEPIDWTLPFTAPSGGDWSRLLAGSVELTMSGWGFPPILDCVLVGPPHVITVDSVTLLIDGDFPTPARRHSWGRLKVIYR